LAGKGPYYQDEVELNEAIKNIAFNNQGLKKLVFDASILNKDPESSLQEKTRFPFMPII